MAYNKTMTLRRRISMLLGIVFILTAQTQIAFAQFVPVRDVDLNPAFTNYATAFDNYVTDYFLKFDNAFGNATPDGTTESLRDLISGKDPGGIAKADCVTGPDPEAMPAFAYQDWNNKSDQTQWGPWRFANASSTVIPGNPNPIPQEIPFGAHTGTRVEGNISHSLRCLLEDQIRWGKLSISIQIHSLLKQYISDAQSKQLQNQLLNKMAAANLNWAKAGVEVDNGGILTTEPVYVTNLNQSIINVNSRQMEHLTDQASADPASGNPVGSLGICSPWRLDTVASVAINNRTDDPFTYTKSQTTCALDDPTTGDFTNQYDYYKFSDNFNDASTKGGLDAFHHMLQDPNRSPLGAQSQLDAVAQSRLERQEEQYKLSLQGSGFQGQTECSGAPNDPYCLANQGTVVQPPGTIAERVTTSAETGRKATQDGDMLDTAAATPAQQQIPDTDFNGLYNQNTSPLATSQTSINNLVQEFFNVIQFGYFGVEANTTEWAQAAMLMIYDEMSFSQDNPNTVVPTSNTTPPYTPPV